MNNNDTINISRRLVLLFVVLCLVFVLPIVWNLFKLMFVEGAEWRSKDKAMSIAQREVKAQRGTIYSADGKILATSLPIYDIIVDFGREKVGKDDKPDDSEKVSKDSTIYYRWIISKETFDRCLPAFCDSMARMFPEKSYEDYYNYFSKARRNKSRYCVVKRGVSYYQRNRMRAFPMLMVDTTTLNSKQKKNYKDKFCRAVIEEKHDVRIHPYGNMARHTIGFLRKVGDTSLYNGLEGFYDSYLRGQQGSRMEYRISRKEGENVWRPSEYTDQKKAIDGQDIVSTIDTRLQDLATNSLYKCVSESQADYGCVILMEVQTGYVRAISSLQFVDSVRGYAELNNQACINSYEPGSTFKTATDMVLLEAGKFDTAAKVLTGGIWYSEDATARNPKPKRAFIKDDNYDRKKKIDTVTMKRSFEISSNVGTCFPVWENYRNNRKEFRDRLVSVLPMDRLGLDLALEEPRPYMIEDLSQPIDFLHLCYGYVSRFTPLQMLTFYNAIANNGKMVKPLFCSEILQGSDTVKKMEPIVLKEKICSDKTLAILNDMLIGVVENGSAHKRLSKTPYGIAGKTGTAQLNYTKRDKESMRYCASFVGYFPTDKPQYSCIVVVFNPKQGLTHGGELAAPVFKDLADRVCGTILNTELKIPKEQIVTMPYVKKGDAGDIRKAFEYLGIKYSTKDSIGSDVRWIDAERDANGNAVYHAYEMPEGVPNCKGMTAKDAVYMLEKIGLKVQIEGRGKVYSQSLRPNSAFQRGATIKLILKPQQQELPEMEQPETTNPTNENDTKKQ